MIRQQTYFLIVILVLTIATLACALTPVSTPLASPAVRTVSGNPTPSPTLVEVAPPTTIPTVALRNAARVVYAKDGTIWLWDAATSARPLTSLRDDPATKAEERDWSPKISEDGLVVVFLRDHELDRELWAVNADGGHLRRLASGGELASISSTGAMFAWPRQFDFAPHSHDIYLNLEFPTASIPGFEYNLARVNADSPVLQALLDGSQGGAKFIFSPDGTKVALLRSDRINVANADGSGLKTVFTFQAVMMTHSDLSYIPHLVWLPDSSGFKTVIPAHDPLGDPSAPSRFMFISADGTMEAKLAEFVASSAFVDQPFIFADGSFASWPFISPDGAKVLYTKTRGADLELHIIDASTTDQMYFSHPAGIFGILGWTPDSTHMMYWLDDRSLIRLGPQQSDAIELSDVPNVENIIWVDAQSYFFVAHMWELRFRTLGQPSILIDSGLSEDAFDFTLVH